MKTAEIRNEVAGAGPDAEEAQIERLLLLDKLKLGPVGYYTALLREDDEILAVAAANVLLSEGAVSEDMRDRIVSLCGSLSVQLRAFDFLMKEYDYDRVRAAIDTPGRSSDELIRRHFEATLGNDRERLADIELERFHRTGDLSSIHAAAAAAEDVGGWREALSLRIDLILANPQDPVWQFRLIHTLRNVNRFDLLERFCSIFEKLKIFPNISAFLRAVLAQQGGDASQGLRWLQRVPTKGIPKIGAVSLLRLRAELLEQSRRFEDAYRAFCEQNELLRSPGFNPTMFREQVKARAAVQVEDSGPDERMDHYMMLGFPRSGTTLLENALAAHPLVETFEEISALTVLSEFFLRRNGRRAAPLDRNFMLEARQRYYREIDRNKKIASARIFVDKMPIASVEAKFLMKIFPEKKYIFSIRHPYDVVLSCFKQPFAPNPAMDNFTTFADSCRVYDFVMNEWFSTFGLDSDHVCYIRYDRLVTDLKAEVTRALAFMGLEWNEDILEFAQRAEERGNKTPSYSKVRQGLTLGVQSSWRNYEFLFRSADARPLDRWVAFFGYEGL
jgi:hypothetical protein